MALSPRWGLLLSGLTGVGKSTLQDALLRDGCWTPRLVTSRDVGSDEGSLVKHASRLQLVKNVQAGVVVAPVIFGGNVYAWVRSDFEKLRSDPVGAVVSTRPYTAFLLAAAVPKLIPIWLDLPEDDRRRRLAERASARDPDKHLAALRLARDSEDELYRELFSHRIPANQTALTTLVQIIQSLPPQAPMAGRRA